MINSNGLQKGIISVISGCMFAGKTRELIRCLSILKYAKKKIFVFKPSVDDRFKKTKITAHDWSGFHNAIVVKTTEDVVNFIQAEEKKGKIDVIAFDEVQFLPIDLFPWIEKWAKEEKTILCAGLDKDYWNEYNSLMTKLLVRADVVIKLSAICNVCQNEGRRTQRMKNNKPTDYRKPKILIGGKESYEARCNKCHQDFE